MKKQNIILLAVICLLSLCLFTGLLVYAFHLQLEKDRKDQNNAQVTQISPTPIDSKEDLSKDDLSTVLPTEAASTEATNELTDSTATDTTASDTTPTVDPISEETDTTDGETDPTEPIVLAFAGDINLDEDSKPVAKYDAENKGILGVIDKELVEEMTSADIMMLNNEFPYSLRGTETPDKSYTFRAAPSRVGILKEMGVDIVSLANNHALDFGPDALEDTFTTLDDAGINYIGAGRTMDRAKEPIYFNVGDKKIAYLAASRVVFAMDWYATDTRSGMIGTYDPTLILESIKEAEANSDYVVIFLHWGVERENLPEEYQRNLAKLYIDAGADAVVGCHPHVLQGFEFYKGKPIAYSLGNYWFNNSTKDAGLLKLYLSPEGSVRMQILPTIGSNTYTSPITKEADQKKYFDFMKEISFDVTIDEDGFVTEAP